MRTTLIRLAPEGRNIVQSEANGNIFVSNEVSITNVARKHSQHCLFYKEGKNFLSIAQHRIYQLNFALYPFPKYIRHQLLSGAILVLVSFA